MAETFVMDDGPQFQELSDQDETHLIASVVDQFDSWKASRQVLEERWRECWTAYLCNAEEMYNAGDSLTEGRSRVVRPVLYEAVEAIQANLLNAMFPSDERFFSIVGETEEDHQHAHVIEGFIRKKLESLGFSEKYAAFLKQAIITGNTAAAVTWKTRYRKRRVMEPVELFGTTVGFRKRTSDEAVFNGPDFEVLDMFDFMIDPDETDFQKAKVIRRVHRALRDVIANPAYRNTDDLTQQTNLDEDANKDARRQAFGIEEGALARINIEHTKRTRRRMNERTIHTLAGTNQFGPSRGQCDDIGTADYRGYPFQKEQKYLKMGV